MFKFIDKKTKVQMLKERIASHVMAIHARSLAPSGTVGFVIVSVEGFNASHQREARHVLIFLHHRLTFELWSG
jgi:hypothetical protein